MPTPERDRVGLPPRVFFYTPDQIAFMFEVTEDYVKKRMLFYEGREPGIPPKTKLRAVNIAPEGETPQWRVSENVLMGYLRSKGVKFYTRGYVS